MNKSAWYASDVALERHSRYEIAAGGTGSTCKARTTVSPYRIGRRRQGAEWRKGGPLTGVELELHSVEQVLCDFEAV